MKNNLKELHNALSTISTKGNDTITMGNCLIFLRQQIAQLEEQEKKDTDKVSAAKENEEDGQ